jgi:hypothetical protein
MLDPSANKAQTPYRIVQPKLEIPERAKFFNLSDALAGRAGSIGKGHVYGTTRVIRIYQNIGTKIDLIQRIDWELRPPSPHNVWVTDREVLESFGLKDYLRSNKIDAVVVKDIRKGVVSPELVRWLVAEVGDAKWFVSSKAWAPSWFSELADSDVRLLLIPPVAAQRAVQEGLMSCWMTRTGYVSQEAFGEIDRLCGRFKGSQHLLVVALPSGLALLAHDPSGHLAADKRRRALAQTQAESLPLVVEVPMASVIFPALAANILRNEDLNVDDRVSLKDILQDAMDFTRQWMQSEVKRVEKPEDWDPDKEPLLEFPRNGESYNSGSWQDFNWEKAKERWRQAFTKLGVIHDNGKKYLDLWRAMIEVDGYVCCVESRRKIIREVVRELRSFVAGGRQHHKSFMLIASPGSGKTYLVSRLAKSLGMHILPFNITQMASKDDLFDCFDTIITTQSQNPARPLLVFVDEMNAELDGQSVYGTFLAPIQEGAYVRAGKTFHIAPCAWIFAGTQHPTDTEDTNRQYRSDKGSDFVSRLTLPVRDLRREIGDDEEEQEKTERVYLGVSLIRTVFPDVLKVSTKVLQMFHGLPKSNTEGREIGAREIEHFVKSFVHVQYSEVLSKNIPTDDERYKGYISDVWDELPEGESVEIKMLI